MRMPTKERLKIADEVWLATAQLHQEHPEADDFSIDEIVWRAGKFEDPAAIRPGVYVHVIQHCVANRPPNPGYSLKPRKAAGGSIERRIPSTQHEQALKLRPNRKTFRSNIKDSCFGMRIGQSAQHRVNRPEILSCV